MENIERYKQVRLADVSKIFTSTSYLKVFRVSGYNELRTFIYCPDQYVPGKMEVDIVKADGFVNGFAIIPDNGVNIVYLTSLLNTYVSWAIMTDNKLEKRTSITLKRLGAIPIRVIPVLGQNAIAYLHNLLLYISAQKKQQNADNYLDYWASVYSELQNAITLELMLPNVFKEYEIELYTSWCKLIEKFYAQNTESDLEHLQKFLSEELLTPQNIVTGNMKKLRVVMKSVIDQTTN